MTEMYGLNAVRHRRRFSPDICVPDERSLDHSTRSGVGVGPQVAERAERGEGPRD